MNSEANPSGFELPQKAASFEGDQEELSDCKGE